MLICSNTFAQPILNRLNSAPIAAFSLRKIKAAANAAIQVRRSSDNSLKDIGFNSDGNLDVADLLQFVGNSDGFVQKWYDQSGNNKDLSNQTSAGQPRIVNGGTVEMQDGKPSILWSNSPLTTLSAQSSIITTDKHTINVISKLNRTTGYNVIVGSTGNNYFGYINAALITNTNGSNKQQRYTTTQTTATELLTSVRDQSTSDAWKNGILLAKNTSTITTGNADINGLGGFLTFGFSGDMSEVIFFNIVLPEADRKFLENNQSEYYSINLPNLPIKIACVGNSVTYGSGLSDIPNQSYPARLQFMLGGKYSVGNFGYSGATMLKATVKPYYGSATYTNALASNPEIVFINLGINDSKPENRTGLTSNFKNDYKSLIASFAALTPKPRVILIKPTPVFTVNDTERSDGINGVYIKDNITPLIEQVAIELGLEVVDLYSPLVGSPEMFPDKVHPNADGANAIAKIIYSKLEGKQYVLPVELSSFTAIEKNDFVQLNWTTMSESNNSHFNVLRSTNGVDFSVLTTIKGMGTTNQPTNYKYTDINSPNESKYYELNQFDYDGKVNESKIIYLKHPFKKLIFQASALIDKQVILIKLTSPKKGEGKLSVSDINGNILLSKKLNVVSGYQEFTLPANLIKGIYLFRFNFEGDSFSYKAISN
jgi:lysophospholipase L1-like esterase